MARGDDFIDEGWPVVRPFLLENGHKNQIQLVDERSLRFQTLLRIRTRDDEVHHKVSYAYTFLSVVKAATSILK